MNLNKYKQLYGEKDGNFHIAQCAFVLPLWAEKWVLRNLRSKKFRLRKKIVKREIIKAIKLGMKLGEQ